MGRGLIVTRAAFVTAVFYILLASTAFAQYSDTNLDTNGLWISMDPLRPQPGDTVHLNVQSPLLDLSKMKISWSIEDVIFAEGTGLVETEFEASALGTDTFVRMTASTASSSVSKDVRIIPTSIDLLYESDSFRPPFFQGRSLPFAGSQVRVQAIPRFVRSDGSLVPSDSIIFTWRRDGAVVPGLSGKGRASATFAAPTLFGSNTITLDAATEDGLYRGTASLQIPSAKPYLALYEKHPLFGILFNRSLSNQTSLAGADSSFVAIPYYVGVSSLKDALLQYDWFVSGARHTIDDSSPNEVSMEADRAGQHATIKLELTGENNPFLFLNGSWDVTLSGSSRSADSAENDPFHPKQ